MSLKLVLLVLILKPELLGQSRSLRRVVDQLVPTAIELKLQGGDLGLKPQGSTLLFFIYPLTITPLSFKVLFTIIPLHKIAACTYIYLVTNQLYPIVLV